MSYATLDDLKRYLDIPLSNTIDDDLLTAALNAASTEIDLLTHRTFVASVDETHKHDALCDVEGLRLWLRGDLAQLTSVTNGDGTTVPLSAIVTEPRVGGPLWAITLKRNSGLSWTYTNTPEDAIAVTGRWAYSIAPDAVIQQATKRLAGWLYRQRDNAADLDRTLIVANTVLTPAQIPADIFALIKPYRKDLA